MSCQHDAGQRKGRPFRNVQNTGSHPCVSLSTTEAPDKSYQQRWGDDSLVMDIVLMLDQFIVQAHLEENCRCRGFRFSNFFWWCRGLLRSLLQLSGVTKQMDAKRNSKLTKQDNIKGNHSFLATICNLWGNTCWFKTSLKNKSANLALQRAYQFSNHSKSRQGADKGWMLSTRFNNKLTGIESERRQTDDSVDGQILKLLSCASSIITVPGCGSWKTSQKKDHLIWATGFVWMLNRDLIIANTSKWVICD